ncbi:hypothetical protein HS7_12450 [Sulfolobales archaeon HS-7]|nr:hypothetical protein HS7_12450 [Sulfolobales archaeon HS-7]
MSNSLERYAEFLEDYARYLLSNKPVIDISLSPQELIDEASRIKAKLKVRSEKGRIIINLNEGEAVYFTKFLGEIVFSFDKLYRPLKIEIEIKERIHESIFNESQKKCKSIKYDNGFIEVFLAKGDAEHWAHIEGEIVFSFDKLYRPLKIEMEIKDLMDNEKVLKSADLI